MQERVEGPREGARKSDAEIDAMIDELDALLARRAERLARERADAAGAESDAG